MPSMTHEGPLDLVRQHPEIAVEFVHGTAGVMLPAQLAVSLAPTDMSAVVPVQYLADMVVLISDAATGKPVLAVIIEPQLRDSETKRYSWPIYVTTARRVARCPASVLVVLCPDPAEAAKCRRLIRTAHPGFDLAQRRRRPLPDRVRRQHGRYRPGIRGRRPPGPGRHGQHRGQRDRPLAH